MTAQMALKVALRDALAPHLRSLGYRGSTPTWTKRNDRDDVAIINVQSSSFSNRDEVKCLINLALAPRPWLEWTAAQREEQVTPSPKEYDGLWRDRLHPSRPTGSVERWWSVRDASSAVDATADMLRALDASGLPLLDALLDRSGMIAAVRAGDLGFRKGIEPEWRLRCLAVLLADDDPQGELPALISTFGEVDLDNLGRRDAELLQHYDQTLVPWLNDRLRPRP